MIPHLIFNSNILKFQLIVLPDLVLVAWWLGICDTNRGLGGGGWLDENYCSLSCLLDKNKYRSGFVVHFYEYLKNKSATYFVSFMWLGSFGNLTWLSDIFKWSNLHFWSSATTIVNYTGVIFMLVCTRIHPVQKGLWGHSNEIWVAVPRLNM